jgi:hypothetical protein
VPASLPLFSRGLKLVRIGVIAVLVLAAARILLQIMAFAADTPDAANRVVQYVQYWYALSLAAALAMVIGVARAMPELRRVRMTTRSVVIATVAFAITAASAAWLYHTISLIRDLQDSITSGDLGHLEALVAQLQHRLDFARYIAAAQDLSYGVGLYFLVRTVQSSAALNEQLALRDRAGHMGRVLLVMVVSDLFSHLTFGVGAGTGGASVTGLVSVLLISSYWVWAHVAMQRFLFDAAWFVNEPHDLPGATVVKLPPLQPAARPSRTSLPRIAPSEPAPPAAPIVIAPPPPAPTPRAASNAEAPAGDGPRFLR